jgi:ribosome-binding factor A
MGKPSYRIERINEQIKEILGELLLGSIKDPRVGMVTITAVRVSSDLSSAKIHYSVMGSETDRDETRKGLESAKSYMRRAVADGLKMRNAPDLRFVYDDSLDKALAIDIALRDAGLGEDAQSEPGPEEDPDPDEDGLP